ncbi:MAG: hypothetical protein ACJA08_001100 [Cyclobacteriaceae bacterium]|jgi:hypothetical protein
MNLIWYNPQLKSYQVGSKVDYETTVAHSSNADNFMILYELDELTMRLANKIVMELNSARLELKSA